MKKGMIVDKRPSAPPPPASGYPRYGIATGASILEAGTPLATVDFELNECQAIGADYIRIDALDTTAYLARYDYVLAGAEARGLQVECCLRGTSAPTSAAVAVDFARRCYQRWGTRNWAYSYVNEPNLGFPATSIYTPTQYAAELGPVYDALKALNPNVLVGGGVMGFAGTDQGSYLPETWWPQVLSAGGSGKFSFVDIHLYDDTTGSNWTHTFDGTIPLEGKPVVVTECGSRNATMSVRQTVLTHALTDPRPTSIAVYTMRNFDGWGLLNGSTPAATRLPSWYTVQSIFQAG